MLFLYQNAEMASKFLCDCLFHHFLFQSSKMPGSLLIFTGLAQLKDDASQKEDVIAGNISTPAYSSTYSSEYLYFTSDEDMVNLFLGRLIW